MLTVDRSRPDAHVLEAMAQILEHRGPDDQRVWSEAHVGLVHTRLSILDLRQDAGQPMSSSDGRFVIVYNGEVYNYQDIRAELSRSGSRFRTRGDTEVVLEAVVRWGVDRAVRRFNGMFAFAVWDRQESTLLLARDRYGVKPLYLLRQGSSLAFASEPKAFTALPTFRKSLDPEAVLEYFTFQNIISRRTFWEDVDVFPPGHWAEARISEEQLHVKEERYWDFTFDLSGSGDPREYEEELRRLLGRAVARQLVSDVEVGSFLSGGLDSGSIAAFASSQIPGLKTFTVGFEPPGAPGGDDFRDEREAAELISASLGTSQFEFVAGHRHVMPAIETISRHLEEPRVGQSYPNLYASRLASGFVKVALAGTGGDEILGGYPWRYPMRRRSTTDTLDWHLDLWRRVLSQDELKHAVAPVWNAVPDYDPVSLHESIYRHGMHSGDESIALLEGSLYFEAKTFLSGLLAVEDRLSMAFGLEVRVPFLDNDLVEFSMAIPAGLRFQSWNGSELGSSHVSERHGGKAILRKAMRGLLPESILEAPKQGFSAPDTSWFAGNLRADVIESVQSHGEVLFDSDYVVQGLLNQPSHRANRLFAWSLLVGARAVDLALA